MQLNKLTNKVKQYILPLPYPTYLTKKLDSIYLSKVSQDIRQRLSIRPGKE